MKNKFYVGIQVCLSLWILVACAPGAPGVVNEPDAVSTIPPLETTIEEPDDAVDVFGGDEPEATNTPDAPAGEPIPSDSFTAPVTATGEVIIISGRVVDVNGNPMAGAIVEFWQTDANGVYDHPNDPDTRNRDPGFQFYGASFTGESGEYRFRTLRPGKYEPRPPHIHVKIKLDGIPVLITQLYFTDSGNDGGLGVGADQLLVTLEPNASSGGSLAGGFDFVIDAGEGADPLDPTPSQAEGPYYPVVNVSAYDNDLASVEN
jgi:protocatechuate 3,4-dioxygenase beta subunit